MEVKPGKLILFVGLFSLIISCVLVYVFLFVIKDNENSVLLIPILVFIICFSIGLYLTLHYYKYRMLISDTSMILTNEFGSKKEIYWNEIQKVDFNKTFKMLVVYKDKKKTWISPVYAHFIDFVPADTYSENLKELIK